MVSMVAGSVYGVSITALRIRTSRLASRFDKKV